jgi:hypothetical protein
MFKVQESPCTTCIYRKDSPLDLAKLESEIKSKHSGFASYRVCHHSKDACCRGFWNAHKNDFQLGQLAQRLNVIEFVQHDVLP